MYATPNTVLNSYNHGGTPRHHGGEFHISYNNVDGWHYGSDTTALVTGNMDKFYILNGDHTKAYKDLIPQGLDACLAYFDEHASQVNKYSDKR